MFVCVYIQNEIKEFKKLYHVFFFISSAVSVIAKLNKLFCFFFLAKIENIRQCEFTLNSIAQCDDINRNGCKWLFLFNDQFMYNGKNKKKIKIRKFTKLCI